MYHKIVTYFTMYLMCVIHFFSNFLFHYEIPQFAQMELKKVFCLTNIDHILSTSVSQFYRPFGPVNIKILQDLMRFYHTE